MSEPFGRRWLSPTNRVHGAWIAPNAQGHPITRLYCTGNSVGYPWRMLTTNDATITCKHCLTVAARRTATTPEERAMWREELALSKELP